MIKVQRFGSYNLRVQTFQTAGILFSILLQKPLIQVHTFQRPVTVHCIHCIMLHVVAEVYNQNLNVNNAKKLRLTIKCSYTFNRDDFYMMIQRDL